MFAKRFLLTTRMQPRRVPQPILSAALNGSVIEPELLNSARIEAKYGNYGIDVIDAEGGVRRSNLYSTATQNGELHRTCRTFSVVCIEDLPSGVVDGEHDAVMRGGSIGAIFKAHGWGIFKETLHTGALELPAGARTIPRLMRLEHVSELAMHIYRLLLSKAASALTYATIVEVHHPDYLGLEELTRSYAADAPLEMRDREKQAFAAHVLREV